MKIKVKETVSTVADLFIAGKVYDLPDDTAKQWILSGLAVAEAVKPPAPPKPQPQPVEHMDAKVSTAKAVQCKATKPKPEAKPETI